MTGVVVVSSPTDRRVTLGTFFGVRSDPIARFTVVMALLLPAFQPFAFDGFMPRLTALETKRGFTRCTGDLKYLQKVDEPRERVSLLTIATSQ